MVKDLSMLIIKIDYLNDKCVVYNEFQVPDAECFVYGNGKDSRFRKIDYLNGEGFGYYIHTNNF